ncbi:sugar ABC transporter ATP-binding protein [Kaistia algarum]|uniref:sugar ABC transporter ATP-binding protein n=1 Tax=Kaistia algarum TaxID=2083279 RepID=UPI000CE7E29C|nr:sugar ABC transporter ATP-binding protein [Kaistia algarum]MCX5515429.1 sugar ABC transporter ATP-binding protein [Kaistia algarum]PPE78512.1 sugar ABC transporter ATP-binding protein [Kaistia algarum]
MSVPIISLHAIEKVYPGVKPLDRVDFTVLPGEIHALLGENGAGKSTLTRIIGGAVKPNAGTIEYLGKPVSWRSPREAQEAGIHIIHQELALFPELTVAENILIGAQPRGLFGLLSRSAAIRKAEAILARLGVDIPARAHIDQLSLADQQMVEIAKALTGDVKLIVFDEPTAVISGREVDLLFENMRRLRSEGLGIVYISHRLEEIFEIADRVTVLKDGQIAGVNAVKDLTRDTMITMMVGRQLEQIFPPKPAVATDKPVVLSIEKLAAGNRLHDASLEVRAGEIVALAGMVGSGRTEVAEAVFGYRDVDAGTIKVDGKALAEHTPKEAIGRGVGFLTENRKEEGLFLGLSIAANILAPSLGTVSSGGMIKRSREREIAEKQIQAFGVATPSQDVKVGNLSGGNQQKVLFSRWSRIADRLLILDEPTRGVDVGAKVEIYRMIRHLADQGIAVLMISSELPEVVGLADRVVVMAQGRVAGELAGAAIGEESIMKLAVVSLGSGGPAGEGKLQ